MNRVRHGVLRPVIILSVSLVSTILGEQGRSETVLIPPLARAVNLDGRVTPEEWAEAATLTILHQLEGRDVESTFSFQYEEKTLWAAAVCPEPDRQRPVFHNPALEVNAALEDSVQVVLGLPGGEQERIDFGGYEDAAGQDLQPVARFMQYIVNSGGNRTQALNEMRLTRTGFDAAVWRGEGQWSVEWRIPLATLGLESPTNHLVYFNFLRVRTPQVTGLSPANFGSSFGAFTFGQAFFLSQAEAGQRTLRKPSTASRSRAPTRPARELELDFYPIAGEVAATLTAGEEPADPQTLQLHVDGVGKKEALVQAGRVRVAVPIRNPGEWPEPGTVFSARARLLDQAGAEIAGTARHEKFAMPARPAWAESDAGAEYVSDKVPPPWSVPEVEGTTVRLRHATLRFGPSGLPASMVTADTELLQAPGRIEIKVDDRAVELNDSLLSVRPEGNQVRVEAEQRFPGGRVQTRVKVEFDGFMVVKVRLLDIAPERITDLHVNLPLRRAAARYANFGLVTHTIELDERGWRGATPSWVGCEDQGLAITGAPYQLEAAGEAMACRVELVAAARPLAKDCIFRFLLQPTPTRPRPPRAAAYSYDFMGWFENWSDYQGYPDLEKMPEVQQRAAAAAGQNRKPVLYFGVHLAENSPGFADFRKDWLVRPEMIWYRRSYDPGKGIPCYVPYQPGPFGDLLLDGIRRLITEGGIGGVYLDGPIYTFGSNPAHSPDGPLSWEEDTECETTVQRTFLKRLRGVFHAEGKDPVIVAHSGGVLQAHQIGFADVFYEGEQLARYRPGYQPPAAVYAVGYSGLPWGLQGSFLDRHWLQGRGAYWSLAYTLLHDAHAESAGSENLLRELGAPEKVTFHPYWRPLADIEFSSKNGQASCSYYSTPEKALVVIGNLSENFDKAAVDLSALVAADNFTAVNVLGREQVSFANGRGEIELPPWRAVALMVDRIQAGTATEAAKPTSPTPTPTGSLAEAQWQVTHSAPWPEEAGKPWPKLAQEGVLLSSVAYSHAATATLTGMTFVNEAEIEFVMAANNRLSIGLGNVSLVHDSGWRLHGDIDGWNTGSLRQVAVPDTATRFQIRLKDGVLRVLAGGRVLIDDIALRDRNESPWMLAMSTWAGDRLGVQIEKANSSMSK